MKSYDKEVIQSNLENEKKILGELKKTYKKALDDIDDKIAQLKGRTDVENMQSIIYQMDYQKALKTQIKTILDDLNTKQFSSISEYLTKSYEEGFVGTMYSLQKQGVPLVMPIDQKSVIKAIVNNTKLSKKLYTKLGQDVDELNKRVQAEVSRGFSQGYSYSKMAQNIAGQTNIGFNKAMRIVKTESHRIRNEAALDAQKKAKESGADVKKQWDATLDKKVRPTHKILDGQIQDVDKPFTVGLHTAMNPGGFGVPGLDINCRCALLQRAKWALDEEELENLKERAKYFELDKTESFEDFKKKYLEAAKDVEGWDMAKEMIESGKFDEAKFEEFSKIHKKHYNYANTVKHQNKKKYGDAWPEEAKKKWETAKQVSDDEVGMLEKIKGLKNDSKATVSAPKIKVDKVTEPTAKATTNKIIEPKVEKPKLTPLEKIKALQKDLESAQEELGKVPQKSYSGIWYDKKVSVSDYAEYKTKIQAKKDWYLEQIASGSSKAATYQKFLDDLDEFEKLGKEYESLSKRVDELNADLDKLKPKPKVKAVAFDSEAYSQERKDKALWYKGKDGFEDADKYFDPPAKKLHKAASKQEKKGFYEYTSGSGGHNRPLAGFRKPFYASGTGWEEKYNVGPKKVWIDFEGKGDEIRALTEFIQKSTYDQDVWLQSGQGYGTLEGFLGLPRGTLEKMTDEQLQQFVGRENRIQQFLSTAVNKGGGSSFNNKPMKFNIYAPKGSQMLYVSNKGAFGKGENEMILQRGASYRITKIYWGSDFTDWGKQKLFVDMEIRVEKGYDLFQQDPDEWKGSKINYMGEDEGKKDKEN